MRAPWSGRLRIASCTESIAPVDVNQNIYIYIYIYVYIYIYIPSCFDSTKRLRQSRSISKCAFLQLVCLCTAYRICHRVLVAHMFDFASAVQDQNTILSHVINAPSSCQCVFRNGMIVKERPEGFARRYAANMELYKTPRSMRSTFYLAEYASTIWVYDGEAIWGLQ